VPTGTSRVPADAGQFVVAGVGASLALFGVLRLAWVETHLVLPLTLWQGQLSTALFGVPRLPLQVTLECSGADALALCAGAVLAFPARLGARLAGAAGGIVLILLLNTVRIGTLGLATPAWFGTLHLYVWPTLLMLAIGGYVFGWMHYADSPGGPRLAMPTADAVAPPRRPAVRPSWRFMGITAACVVVFAAATPLYLESAAVLAFAGLIATAAAALMSALGVSAQATANVLTTSRGAFIVTQECITTPLLPVYLAAVITYAASRRWLVLGLLATVPLFAVLGLLRLLVVAVPATIVASPLFYVHAFYQLLLGAVAIWVTARWRQGPGHRHEARRALAGLFVGTALLAALGPVYGWLAVWPVAPPLADPQGALAFLPSFQFALFLAMCVAASGAGGWRRVAGGLSVLLGTQVAGFVALQWLAAIGITAQVRDVRAWAIAAPVLIFAAVVTRARTTR